MPHSEVRHPRLLAAIVVLAATVGLMSACTGEIGNAPDASITPDTTVGFAAAPARARRLSHAELVSSVRDVLGVDIGGVTFPTENSQNAFDNQYEALSYSDAFALALEGAAEIAGAGFTASLGDHLACATTLADANAESACLETFIGTYGMRMYRRPVRDSEHDDLAKLFTTTRADSDFATSIATVVEAMVQSPSFMFRTELGDQSGALVALTPYEMASALSYFLWRSAPDDALLAAAQDGSLATADGVAQQTKRLLADPRAHAAMRDFFTQWLELTSITTVGKSDPALTPATLAAMLAETMALVDAAVWNGGGYSELLTGTHATVDAGVAAIYGLPAGGNVQLDATQRAGFLTEPAFITTHTPGERSPVTLGHFVRAKFFCQPLPPPPAGVPPVSTDPTLDVHARFSQHDTDPNCSSCHHLMDPIGFGYSQFDVVGRFSPVDHGVTEDGAGELVATDVDGTFHGPVELAQRLVASTVAKQCVSEAFAEFALGRSLRGDVDDATIARLAQSFAGGDFVALMTAIVNDDAFRLRDTTALEGPLP